MSNEINTYFSQVANEYPASGIRKMFEIAAQYDPKEIVNLTVGEPNFDTPQNVKDAAKKAIDDGFTHYNPNAGMPALREAVAESYAHYNCGYQADNVIITVGALEALTLGLLTIVNPGDEVLVPDPCFPNYLGQIMITKAKPVTVPVYEENDYKIQAEDIEKAITPKTRAIILNSPSNPLGSILEEEDVRAIARVVEKYNLYVFSDEVYDKIIYDGHKHFSMAQIPELTDQVMVMNSFSKAYAMTGWRIGYLLADSALTKRMAQIQEGMVSCVSTFTQVAAIEALKGPQTEVQQMIADYTRRREILIDGLNAIPGFSVKKSPGSFYAFANIKAFGKTSQEFAEDLVREAKVITVPGSAFGSMGEGYMRFVFANSDENLKEALQRIDAYVKKNY